MSDILIKMAKDLRDMSDMVGDLHWMAAKAVEDLTKKEGEIAKRDAIIYDERIDADLQRQELDAANSNLAGLRAELSAIKAQGVVMPRNIEKSFLEWASAQLKAPTQLAAYMAGADEVARLNDAPAQQGSVPDGFVLAKETVVEMPDGSKELGYTIIGRVGIFNSAEEVFDAIRELDLPLGWVSMTTEQLLPGWMRPSSAGSGCWSKRP